MEDKKRIALFAHYDQDGIIDDYVIYYLNGLQKVAQRILFASNCKLQDGEAAKLEGIAELVFAERHDEYDFGSWKRCFEYINYDLTGWDEVIVANDSCYAPITPLEDLFEKMEKVECDFWSPSAVISGKGSDHLSAYFVTFKCVTGMQAALYEFFSNVTHKPDYLDRVELFERGLSKFLRAKGYTGAAYVSRPYIIVVKKEDMLLIPFVKTKALRCGETYIIDLIDNVEAIGRTYPRRLIDAHMKRMIGTSDPAHYHRKIVGMWKYSRRGLSITSKIKHNKYKNPRYLWWKLYASLFGVPFFAFVWPIRNRYIWPVRSR